MMLFKKVLGGMNASLRAAFRVAILPAICHPVIAADYGGDKSKAFRNQVLPVMKQFCFHCHGGEAKEPDDPVRLDRLNPDLVKGPHAETWHEVLNHLNRGEMPPEEEPQPSRAQRQAVVDWVTTELERAVNARRKTGGRAVLRRLTRYEYSNTMRDLLGVDLDFAKNLPPEPTSPEGFKNNGTVLGISPLQIEYYLKTAREALAKTIVVGDKPQVYTSNATESAARKRSKKDGTNANRLVTNEQFLVRLKEFPRRGKFRVRVRARAEVPEKAGYPRMQLSVGVRADTKSPEELVGVLDVTATNDAGVYEFTGQIDDYPLPGHNPKFPGMLMILRNVYTQQDVDAKRSKGNKNKQNDPTLPVIVVESFEFEGPVFDEWPPKSHTRILFARETGETDAAYARRVLARFMPRAWRRPVAQEEVESVAKFFDEIRPRSPSLEEAMRETLARILISPEFLYLAEPKGESNARASLTDFELASRLSFFLWSTMPDETLFGLAQQGKLQEHGILEQQVRRMIKDEKSWNFVRHYTDQWLNLSGLDRVAINPEYYPDFDNRLKGDMRAETQHFFAEILYKDLSYLNVVDSDFTMLNRRLARHYDLPGPRGSAFERLSLKPQHGRGGLLTHGSTLLSNSTGEDSHPIRRAVWILDRLLDDPPAPPPPDVPELDSKRARLAGLTVRQQLEVHRKKDACNSCHRGIDPWGIPLQHYDAIGLWRETIKGPVKGKRNKVTSPEIDANSVLPGGHEVNGAAGLKSYLKKYEKDRLARACVTRLLAYSLGRSIDLGDRPAVESLTKSFAENGYRLGDLIVEIVKSEPFRLK